MKELTIEEIVEIDVILKEKKMADFLDEEFRIRISPEMAMRIGIDTARAIYMQGVWAGVRVAKRMK